MPPASAAKAGMAFRTVGELVETRETVAKLREVGVDYAQGFAVAAPKALE